MKKIFLFILTILSICTAKAQMGTIPNYFLADNSNFIVLIATEIKTGISYSEKGGNEFTELNPNDFTSPDDKTFISIANLVRKKFGTMGLKPADYLSFNYTKFTTDELNKISESVANHTTGFMCTIIITDRDAVDKAVKKNKLELSNCKMVTVSVAKPNETDITKTYTIFGAGMDLAQAFDQIEKDISKQKPDYFVKTMNTPDDIPVISKEEYDKMLSAKDSVQGFPLESELKNSELLILCGFKKDGVSYKRFDQILKKKYPYKYRIISTQEYWEECKKPEPQYVMLLKGNSFAYTASGLDYIHRNNSQTARNQSSSKNWGDSDAMSQEVYIFQYVIKDMKALKLYLGNCKDCRYSDITAALRSSLRKMGDFYKWVK